MSSNATNNTDGLLTSLPIGKIIHERVEALCISKAALARRLNMSPANVHKIFKRKTIDVTLLCRLSQVLSYDFLAIYQAEVVGHIHYNRNFISYGHSEEEKARYMLSLDRRIDLMSEILRGLVNEDVRNPTIDLDAKLAIAQELLEHSRGTTAMQKFPEGVGG